MPGRSFGRGRGGAASPRGAIALVMLLVISATAGIWMARTTIAWEDGAGSRDDNDSFDTAIRLANNVQTNVTYLGLMDDPADFYWIYATRGQAIEASMIILRSGSEGYDPADPGKVNFDLEVYGPDRSKLLISGRTTNQFETESVVALVDGNHYFKALAVNGSGNYVLTVEVYDPQTVVDDGVYSGYLKHDSDDDTQWYKVSLKGGDPAGAIWVNMSTDNTGNLDLFLMDMWSKEKMFYVDVSWSVTKFEEKVQGVASYSGLYFIKVHAYSGYANYQIRVDLGQTSTDNDNDKGHAHLLEYNTTWSDRVDQAQDKYDFFELRLMPQENISVDLVLLNNWDDIYAVFLLDVDLVTIMEKTNYIMTPVHDTGPDIKFWQVVDGGVYYIVVQSRVALMPNPDDLSDETAAADYKLTLNMSKHPQRPVNKAPLIRAGYEDLSIFMNEDASKRMNLNDVFVDPEGDKLSFKVKVIDGSLTASVDMSGLLTIVPGGDWFGTGHLNLSAMDPEGLGVLLLATVVVNNLPEPPIVEDYSPSKSAKLAEGTTQLFTVKVTDKDSLQVHYNWSLDGIDKDVHMANFSWTPDYLSAGPHTVVAKISDGTITVDWEWDIVVNNTNRRPLIVSMLPSNATKYQEGRTVKLKAVISDPDGDQVTYTWKEGLLLLGTGSGTNAELNRTFSPGKHTVKISVSDTAGGIATGEVTFKIEQKDTTWDWGFWLIAVLITVFVSTLVFSYIRRPRKVNKAKWDKDIDQELGEKRGRRGGRKGRSKRERSEHRETMDQGLEDDIASEIKAERKRLGKRPRGRKR